MTNPKSLLDRLAIAFDDVDFGDAIGEGRNCRVFKGHWKSKNVGVAIKTLSGGLKQDEIEIMEKFDHPNVVRLFGIVSHKPSFFIISELAERGTIYGLLHKKHHRPSKEQAMKWAKEMAEGMNYLHHMMIIHRDLKSKSVFVTEDWTIKLGGFGQARSFDRTALQTMAGTFRWMAPEFLMGNPVGLSCDVYSYGMVLLEILTCNIPFAGIGDLMVNARIAAGSTPEIPENCEPYMAELLKICWKTDPKARPTFNRILTILETKAESISGSTPGPTSVPLFEGNSSIYRVLPASILPSGTKVRDVAESDVEITDEIGMGTNCRVYKGKWKSQNMIKPMTIAIKPFTTGDFVTKEIEILAALHHPNIVEFFGIVRAKPSYYILTELAASGSLFQFLHKDKLRPDHDQTHRWPIEMARGMNYLHERNVVHRDLKSKRVLLTDTWTIKLGGFGSKKFDFETLEAVAPVPFRWMAPEVIRGDQVSKSCDVFSYGMVILEIHTCELPYAEVPELFINTRIAAGQIPNIPPGCCEPYLIELLERCWETEPLDRPSFHDILSVLDNKDTSMSEPSGDSYDGSLKESHLPRLLEILESVWMLWYPIGIALKVNSAVLRDIASTGADPTTSLSTLLTHWLSIRDPLPTAEALAEALKSPMVNEKDAAKSLLQEYPDPPKQPSGRRLFEEAMKSGFVESLNIKVIFFGTAGAGKTCSKAAILGLPPPVNRISTDMAERPVRAVCVDMNTWLIMGPEEVKEELATAIRAAATTHQVVNTDEEAPEEDSGSATATLSQAIPSTSDHIMSQDPSQDPSLPIPDEIGEKATPVREMPKASRTEEELVELIDKAVVPGSVAGFKWVHFLDTGGQPQFHEVFRAFLKRASLCMFVQKLSERLDDYPLVEYYDENSQLVGKPYHTAITHQQILAHCTRSMLSHALNDKEKPKILVVGTHVDKEHLCTESREAKNKRLIELLVPAFPEQVVYYGQDRKQLIFPLNAQHPGEAEKRVAKEIREVILNQCSREPDKIPLRWFALEQALQELAQKKGRAVLKKDECFAVAKQLHFDQESFEAALQYLHDLNIIFYYHDILPEFIFCNPQVVIDKVTELVKRSHQMKGEPTEGVACSAEWGKFEAFGLVTVELLGKFPKHYIPGVFSPVHLVELCKELLILANLNEVDYFMPSLLQVLDRSQIADRHASCHSDCAPLVVYFPDGLPLGMLCSLVVFLLSPENHYPRPWKLQVDQTMRNPTCLFRNCIKFVIPNVPGSVTIFDSLTSFFEIHVCVPFTLLPQLCPLVRDAVFAGLNKAFIVLGYNNVEVLQAIVCACDDSSCHPATFDKDWWICSKSSEIFGELHDKHRFWLTNKTQPIPNSGSVPSTTPPGLDSEHSSGTSQVAQLDDGDIMEITDYLFHLDKADIYNLGMVLGLSQTRVKAMEDSKTFLDDVIAGWIMKKDFVERRGLPTWETLVRALRHRRIGQTGLANDISRDKNITQQDS